MGIRISKAPLFIERTQQSTAAARKLDRYIDGLSISSAEKDRLVDLVSKLVSASRRSGASRGWSSCIDFLIDIDCPVRIVK